MDNMPLSAYKDARLMKPGSVETSMLARLVAKECIAASILVHRIAEAANTTCAAVRPLDDGQVGRKHAS